MLAVCAMVLAGVLAIAGLGVCWLVMPHYERSHEPAAYRVVYSDMLEADRGGILTIDAEGGIISDTRLAGLRNAAEYSYEDGVFIAGGRRANTHLIVNGNGNLHLFHLLGEKRYSGVMSIEPHAGGVAAVMNGSDSLEDDSYLNLLVIEDRDGNIMERRMLKIYTEGQATSGNHLFITGHQLTLSSNRYQGKIIRYDYASHAIKERVTDDGLLYRTPVTWDGKVLAIGTDMDGAPGRSACSTWTHWRGPAAYGSPRIWRQSCPWKAGLGPSKHDGSAR